LLIIIFMTVFGYDLNLYFLSCHRYHDKQTMAFQDDFYLSFELWIVNERQIRY
jgi:hypothetical protein